MSDKNYIKMYDYLTNNQKDAMTDLWMTGINTEDGVIVKWKDVEKTVAILIKEWMKHGK